MIHRPQPRVPSTDRREVWGGRRPAGRLGARTRQVVPNEEVAVPTTPSAPTGLVEAEEQNAPSTDGPLRRASRALVRRWALLRRTAEAGMSTAEYAVGTVAACAFAAVLYRVVTGGSVVTGLTKLVESALATLS